MSRTSRSARRRPCWPRCSRPARGAPGTGRAVVDVVVRDDTGRLKIVFFNQPWRAKQLEAGTEAIFFGKVTEYRGARQLTNPVVDVVAGVTPGRKTLRILPVYPASAKAGLTSWEIGEFVTEALERAGEFADPLPVEWRDSIDLWDRTDAFRAIHGPESLDVVEPARRRLVFDELFRLQLALVLRRRAFEDNARAPAPRRVAARGDRRGERHPGGALPGRPALRAHEGAAPGPGRHCGRHGGTVPDAPPPAGRRRLGQDRGRAGRAARRGAERAPGRPHGADRGPGRTALLGRARPPRHAGGPRWHGGRRGARGAPHQPGQGQGPHRGPRGAGLGRREHRGRDARPPHRGGRVRFARRGGDRRATPVRRGAAGHAAGQGHRRRPGPAGDDGDTDPAHGRHGDLRRSRPDHARRDAARAACRSRPSGCPATRPPARRRPGTGSARRWRPAIGPSSSARW